MVDKAKRAGLRLFRRSEARSLREAPIYRMPEMDQAALDAQPLWDAQVGASFEVLFGDPTGGGMSLVRLRFAPDYMLPRHSHDVDCLYYVVAGEVHLGNRVLVAGDGYFSPADAPYTYRAGRQGVEVLEFRATSSVGIRFHEDAEGWARLIELVNTNRDRWTADASTG